MSERRWWTLPKMFAFPLWHSASHANGYCGHANNAGAGAGAGTAGGANDSGLQKRPVESKKATSAVKAADVGSSDDEDLEEFLEKQRNVRLGYVEVGEPSPAKSNRKYSSSDEKFKRSLSKRTSRSSSSKSSGSTKYSSFGKASDTENDKTIKETIYESGVSQISFSFFSDNGNPEQKNVDQQLYCNVENATNLERDEPELGLDARTREHVHKGETDSQTDSKSVHDGVESSAPVFDSVEESSPQTDSGDALGGASDAKVKDRHVTKLTILLTSARAADGILSEEMSTTASSCDRGFELTRKEDGERIELEGGERGSASSAGDGDASIARREDDEKSLPAADGRRSCGEDTAQLAHDAEPPSTRADPPFSPGDSRQETASAGDGEAETADAGEGEGEAAGRRASCATVDKCDPAEASWPNESFVGHADYADYAELGELREPPASAAAAAVAEAANMDYCDHRARVRGRRRQVSLRRKRHPAPASFALVNSRLNRAWRSLRGWWRDEKQRLTRPRPRSAAAAPAPEADGGRRSVPSDESFYEAIKKHRSHENVRRMDAVDDADADEDGDGDADADGAMAMGDIDEDGYCSLEPRRRRDRRRYSSAADAAVPAADDRTLRRKSCISQLSAVRSHPPHPPPPPRTSGVNAFRKSKYYPPQGQDGFEDLRRYIKQGGDFCKELSIIFQERSEAEIQYAKTLSKLSSKLLKVSKEAVGTVSQAWHKAGIELETTSEIHKTFATALCEEVVKPLKQLLESQHRIRKSVENAVDKTGKNLSEWRTAESKSKKQSFVSARENEKLQDITLDVRLSGGLSGSNKITASSLHLHQKQGSEKESSKLDTKRKKAEELVKKADVEYYTYCLRAERARLEWETAVVRGSQCFQALEEERLQQLKHLAFVYWQHCRDIGPKLTQSAVRLKEPIEGCDVSTDIKTIASTKGVEHPVSEQLLPDFYAEHTTLAMNRERRRQALVKVLQLVVQDLERERRGKNGVENLARAFKQSPNFGNDDSQQNVSEKLHHMRFMLTYLEAARYKLSCALAELDGKPKPSHPLASHIHVIRDRQGFQQSILKVPPWVHKENIECAESVESPEWTDRGTADGNSVQPDSDFDEFSSQSSSEKDYESNVFAELQESVVSTPSPLAHGKCRALYQYTANLYDELNLQPGDVINIHDKQPDGWWLGELNGVIGIFPATYVEEIS